MPQVVWQFTHAFSDEAPFLLSIELPLACGRSCTFAPHLEKDFTFLGAWAGGGGDQLALGSINHWPHSRLG